MLCSVSCIDNIKVVDHNYAALNMIRPKILPFAMVPRFDVTSLTKVTDNISALFIEIKYVLFHVYNNNNVVDAEA